LQLKGFVLHVRRELGLLGEDFGLVIKGDEAVGELGRELKHCGLAAVQLLYRTITTYIQAVCRVMVLGTVPADETRIYYQVSTETAAE